MNYPYGGAVACIMNSRVGLGTPPDMGPSEHLSLEFYHKVFDEDMHRIGMAHGVSKDVWLAVEDWPYDFCIAELNLFGDAALFVWTGEPQIQTVEHPSSVDPESGPFTVTVRSGGSPVEGALVCVMSEHSGIYDYADTDASGNVTFDLNPTEDDTLYVTSVVADHIPYEGFSLIESDNSGIGGSGVSPEEISLRPLTNPCVGSARLRFGLPRAGVVRISAFDVTGRLVAKIVERSYDAGFHEVRWETGEAAKPAPGLYYLSLVAGDRSVTRPVILLR
jgi:hypothetical protein